MMIKERLENITQTLLQRLLMLESNVDHYVFGPERDSLRIDIAKMKKELFEIIWKEN
jgi:hypothetical protein